MFLALEIDIKPKRIYIRFCIRVVMINISYSTNAQPIWKLLYPTGAWESQICSCYNFLILFCIFNTCSWNYYYVLSVKSVLRHQNFHQWQCSIVVTCLRQYHMTTIPQCYWRKFLWRHNRLYRLYIRFGIILTQFYINFSRQEH